MGCCQWWWPQLSLELLVVTEHRAACWWAWPRHCLVLLWALVTEMWLARWVKVTSALVWAVETRCWWQWVPVAMTLVTKELLALEGCVMRVSVTRVLLTVEVSMVKLLVGDVLQATRRLWWYW